MTNKNWRQFQRKKGSKYCVDFWKLCFVAIMAHFLTISCSSTSNLAPKPLPEPTTATSPNLITLHYNERPPYLVTTDQSVEGLTGDPATIVFEISGIPYQWKQTPSKRQLYLLEQNTGRDCLVGWFKIPEREEYAKYTFPIYQDRPQIALARADNDRISAGIPLSDIFSDPNLIILVKDGYSYGEFLDNSIQTYNPILTETTVENSAMLKMVYARHADYFLIAPEEAIGLIESSEFDLQDFKFVNFSDIPNGEKRYILCSMQVEDEIIEQLNTIIHEQVNISSLKD